MIPIVRALLLAALTPACLVAANQPVVRLIEGLPLPESAAVGPDGKIYVSTFGERDNLSDGAIVTIADGKATTFASGLGDPKGIAFWKEDLYVSDRTKVWRIPPSGKAEVFADAEAFPILPLFFNDLSIDDEGNIYVADSGNRKGEGGAIFRIAAKDKEISLVVGAKAKPEIKMPNGLLPDGKEHVLMADFLSGILYRVRISDGSLEALADGLGAADGIVRDAKGNLYVSDWKGGHIFLMPGGTGKPERIATGFVAAADICLSGDGKSLIIPDLTGGTVSTVSIEKFLE
jgi:sugar lactone lactonase YvrE